MERRNTLTAVLAEKAQTVSVEDALAIGERRLAETGVDMTLLGSLTLTKFEAIKAFQSEGTAHYCQKIGYSEADAAALFDLVKRFLALSTAWHELGYKSSLSLPDRVDTDGWHGFIIQTVDYAAIGQMLGRFVHHTTTEGAQGERVTITMTALASIFGQVAPELWTDCPGCIVYGWCSDPD